MLDRYIRFQISVRDAGKLVANGERRKLNVFRKAVGTEAPQTQWWFFLASSCRRHGGLESLSFWPILIRCLMDLPKPMSHYERKAL